MHNAYVLPIPNLVFIIIHKQTTTDPKQVSEPTVTANNKSKTNNANNKPEITVSSVSNGSGTSGGSNVSGKESSKGANVVSSSMESGATNSSKASVASSTGSKRLEIVQNLQEKMDNLKKPPTKKRESISK